MSILVNRETRVLVHGLTGRYAGLQAAMMKQYGTRLVAGVAPGRGGETLLEIPLYDSVREALMEHAVDAAIIYVPAPLVLETFYEISEQGIGTIFIATEGVPVHDTLRIRRLAELNGLWVIGPNSLGIITPSETLLGSMDATHCRPGSLGLISRSGTLSILVMSVLHKAGFGFSTAISIGGDFISGRSQADYLKRFERDPQTLQVVMLAEIGGSMEYQAAEQISRMSKPVICYLVGRQAPRGKTMGHSGAIIRENRETVVEKEKALSAAGAMIVQTPWEIPALLETA
ncbi:MAG: CoA-binding protein [bacterium]